MTYVVSVARSDTLTYYPLASFGRQPAPDCPGGGFTIGVIGVCHLYPGPGGWAAVFASGAEISGGGSATTSDQMYILAATRALDATPIGAIVNVLTGSNLLVQVLRRASARRGNADLWRALDQACALRQVTFSQIKDGEIAVRALAEAEYEHQVDDGAAALLPLLSARHISAHTPAPPPEHNSDIVSLHCLLAPETHCLIGAGAVAQVREGRMLINSARHQSSKPATVSCSIWETGGRFFVSR